VNAVLVGVTLLVCNFSLLVFPSASNALSLFIHFRVSTCFERLKTLTFHAEIFLLMGWVGESCHFSVIVQAN
jgi:hypothetical protein